MRGTIQKCLKLGYVAARPWSHVRYLTVGVCRSDERKDVYWVLLGVTGQVFCRHAGTQSRQVANDRSPYHTLSVELLWPERILDMKNSRVFAVVGIFVVCGVFDLVLGYGRTRSFPAGIVSVVLGLFGTAFYAWIMGAFRRDSSNDPDSRQR
jgi:hypothetical protein